MYQINFLPTYIAKVNPELKRLAGSYFIKKVSNYRGPIYAFMCVVEMDELKESASMW